MPLNFHPSPGAIVICDFTTGFRPPEMVKKRPVVIVSPRRRHAGLVTIIPLSSTPPFRAEPWHHLLSQGVYPPARSPMWAKCDILNTVGLDRLDRVRDGRRGFTNIHIPEHDLHAIMAGIRSALGML